MFVPTSRASAVLRIARFPIPRSPLQKAAWTKGKAYFYTGAALMEYPIHQVLIPHTYALPSSSESGSSIPVNLLIPPTASPSSPCPLVLIMTGLDGYRTELAVWQRGWLEKGVATLVVEIPGTGDSPALPNDPTSPDRQWSSVLDWLASSSGGREKGIDPSKIIVWGFSTGGYYALRIAHTHASQLLGSVSLGGGCHHMFDREWLDKINNLEYPFDLANTLAYKFGYGSSPEGLEKFKQEGQKKFSLLLDGTLARGDRDTSTQETQESQEGEGKKTSCKMLLVNGEWDRIFPIEDLTLALKFGQKQNAPKKDMEARIVEGRWHMGEPESFVIILKWIHELLGLDGDWVSQMRGLGAKAK